MLFKVPLSLGTLPQSSGSVSEDLRFTGNDGTIFTIKGGVGSTFAKDNTIEYAPGKDQILFQFIFPEATSMNPSKTEFNTQTQSYLFTEVPDVIISGTIRKNMKGGSVEIRQKDAFELPVQSFIQSKSSAPTTVQSIKSHPLYSIGYILYLWGMDMIRVLIFWVLLASIYCWLMVPSKYLYPTDVSKFPYVYYEPGENAYGYLKQKENDLCTLFTKSDRDKSVETQKKWFDDLDQLDEGPRGILKVLFPSILEHRTDGVNMFSSLLLNKCEQKDPCTSDYIAYFVISLFFYQYLYCNTILAGIHTGAKSVKESFSGIPKPILTVLLAILLYTLFSGVSAINDGFIRKMGLSTSSQMDIGSLIKNQFKAFLVAIVSCCICLILPLCSILIVTCLMTTAFVLFKACIAPYNGIVVFIAILTILSSISKYVFLIRNLMRGLNPFDLLESMYVTEINKSTLLSFLGITIPILFGLLYGSYIGINLFMTFFQFIKRPDVQELFKSSFWSFLMVGFLLLFLHVQKNLGGFYATLTLSIIIFMGISVYFQQMAMKALKKKPIVLAKEIIELAPENVRVVKK